MRALTIFLIVVSGGLFAQNWSPISLETKSVFTKSTYPSPLACFDIDSVVQLGVDSSMYYNYQLYGDNSAADPNDYPACQGWGPTCSLIANTSSWLGREIFHSNNTWNFITNNQDTLKFNFLNIDTATVFESANRKLQLIYINDTVLNVLGVQDSVKQFEILQFDGMNNLILDELSNKIIKLSKDHGLINFIEVRDYPDSIGFYSMMGSFNQQDTLGKVLIKKYEFYKKTVGTISQLDAFQEDYYSPSGTFIAGYHNFPIKEILTSQFIDFNYVYSFSIDTTNIYTYEIDTNLIEYSFPFTKDYASNWVSAPHIDSTECYGLGYYLVQYFTQGMYYCDTYDCYSAYDTGTLISSHTEVIVPEIGVLPYITYTYDPQNPTPYPPPPVVSLIYSNVLGIECGNIAFAGIEEVIKEEGIILYPNPATNVISIELQKGVLNDVTISVSDLLGNVILTEIFSGSLTQVDISKLSKGSYSVAVLGKNEILFQKQFIKI